uniref:Uncharacterized protein n=1 Tax=Phakopsora pachyrhizi TaxID=170000 RepID=A0A0S1MKE5_PHAPC
MTKATTTMRKKTRRRRKRRLKILTRKFMSNAKTRLDAQRLGITLKNARSV